MMAGWYARVHEPPCRHRGLVRRPTEAGHEGLHSDHAGVGA